MNREVILPRRALSQPSPFLVQGGDCGACVFGGLFALPTVEAAYEKLAEFHPNNPHSSVQYDVMRNALGRTADASLLDAPLWPIPPEWTPFGHDARNQYGRWQSYIRMGVEAGYYCVALVDFAGTANQSDGIGGADHWVLICGWRPDHTGVTVIDEVLVSCPARHPQGEWKSTREFLFKHGGFNVMLARPA